MSHESLSGNPISPNGREIRVVQPRQIRPTYKLGRPIYLNSTSEPRFGSDNPDFQTCPKVFLHVVPSAHDQFSNGLGRPEFVNPGIKQQEQTVSNPATPECNTKGRRFIFWR